MSGKKGSTLTTVSVPMATPRLHQQLEAFKNRRFRLGHHYHLAYHHFHDELEALSNLIKKSRLYSETLALRESWHFWKYPKVPTIAVLATGVALSLLCFNGAFSKKAEENSGFQLLSIAINFAIQFVGEKLFRFVYTKVHSCWLSRHLGQMKEPGSVDRFSQDHRDVLREEYELAKKTELHLLDRLSGLDALKSAHRAFSRGNQIPRRRSQRYLDFVRRQILVKGLSYLPQVIALGVSLGVEFLAPQWKDIKIWEAALSTALIGVLTGISWATPTFLLEAISGFAGWFKSDGCLMHCFKRCTCRANGEDIEEAEAPGCSDTDAPASYQVSAMLSPDATPALHKRGPSAGTSFLGVLREQQAEQQYGATASKRDAGAGVGSGGGAAV